MTFLSLIGIAIAMGMDVFSVSMAVAAGPAQPRQAFRLSFHFGLFQGFMPIIGWALGQTVVEYVEPYDHWVAFIMLAFIGGHMLWESFYQEDEVSENDRSKGWSLIVLSIATSIDALGVGLMLGVQDSSGSIWWAAIVIGITSSIMSLFAIFLSRRFKESASIGPQMEKVGGIILILIGLKFLIEGLMA
jgi:manganese efflux pump family protein